MTAIGKMMTPGLLAKVALHTMEREINRDARTMAVADALGATQHSVNFTVDPNELELSVWEFGETVMAPKIRSLLKSANIDQGGLWKFVVLPDEHQWSHTQTHRGMSCRVSAINIMTEIGGYEGQYFVIDILVAPALVVYQFEI